MFKIIAFSLATIIIIFIGLFSDRAINTMSILVSIYTLMLIYKERKIANYNQKTIELRNEMYAVFNRIDDVRAES